MTIFKCKMCGGTLNIVNNETFATCEYCGTKQTLPNLTDSHRLNLYERANHLRRNNEFDKAMTIYEQILNEDSRDAEAYWSLVLCCYGIEYVDDPMSHMRIPTVNRTQFTSIYDDENYKSAILYADSYQKEIYEEEAKAINEIQKEILSISLQEAPFDIFICYKETDNNGRRTQDSVLANDLYYQLTQEGYKVFFSRITLEDKIGIAYEPYIFAALNSAKIMIVLGTKPEYFNAVWVKNEWSRFLAISKQDSQKLLIPAYRDMNPYDLPKEFSHLQAQDMSKLGFMQDLIRGITKILSYDKNVISNNIVSNSNTNITNLLKRANLFLEDGDFKSADEYYERVLDIEVENAQAYVGKLLVELKICKKEELMECKEPFNKSANFQKALQYADENLKKTLNDYIDKVNENIKLKEQQIEEEKRIEEKHQKEMMIERQSEYKREERKRQKAIQELEELEKREREKKSKQSSNSLENFGAFFGIILFALVFLFALGSCCSNLSFDDIFADDSDENTSGYASEYMQEILAQSSDSEYEENNQNVDSNNSEKKECIKTLTVDSDQIYMTLNETAVLNAKINDDTLVGHLRWECGNDDIIEIDANGKTAYIHPKQAGETTITVYGDDVSKELPVKVCTFVWGNQMDFTISDTTSINTAPLVFSQPIIGPVSITLQLEISECENYVPDGFNIYVREKGAWKYESKLLLDNFDLATNKGEESCTLQFRTRKTFQEILFIPNGKFDTYSLGVNVYFQS